MNLPEQSIPRPTPDPCGWASRWVFALLCVPLSVNRAWATNSYQETDEIIRGDWGNVEISIVASAIGLALFVFWFFSRPRWRRRNVAEQGREQQCETSLRHMNAALWHISEAVALVGLDGRIIWGNRALALLLDQPFESLPGLTVRSLLPDANLKDTTEYELAPAALIKLGAPTNVRLKCLMGRAVALASAQACEGRLLIIRDATGDLFSREQTPPRQQAA